MCRDRECEARRGGSPAEAQVTPDGATAFLGATPKGALFWSSSDGFRSESWSDPSLLATLSDEPVLAPDGSLRAVTASRVRRSCTFELYTTGTRDGVLDRGGRAQRPTAWPRVDGLRHLHRHLERRLAPGERRRPPSRDVLVRPRRRGLEHHPGGRERSRPHRRRPWLLRLRDGRLHPLERPHLRVARRPADPGAEPPARRGALERAGGARRRPAAGAVHLPRRPGGRTGRRRPRDAAAATATRSRRPPTSRSGRRPTTAGRKASRSAPTTGCASPTCSCGRRRTASCPDPAPARRWSRRSLVRRSRHRRASPGRRPGTSRRSGVASTRQKTCGLAALAAASDGSMLLHARQHPRRKRVRAVGGGAGRAWSWRESNPRPRASYQVFSGCSQ